MTSDPAYPPRLDPAAGVLDLAPAPAAGRPKAVTVLAGIGIALGALGFLCKPTQLLMFFLPMPDPTGVITAMRDSDILRAWTFIAVATGLLLSLLLLLSSFGSLGLKPWARTGMLAYAALALAMTLVSQGAGLLVVGPEMQEIQQRALAGRPAPPFQLIPEAGAAIGLAVGLWFPILILYYYTRRRVIDAFEQGLPGSGI